MKRYKVCRIFLLCLAILAAGFATTGILRSRSLQVKQYTIPLEEVSGTVRIVLLSDLHCRQFGKDNIKLLELIAAQEPDLIALDGDLFSRSSSEKEIMEVCDFARKLTKVAPTYYALGNHESDYIARNGSAVLEQFTAAGVTILEDKYQDLTINGTIFRFGGMSQLAYRDGANEFDSEAEVFLNDYCNTELPTVLLSHRPEAFCFKNACKEWDVDLILSGHTHGGLVRLPGLGGVYAPIQGWFPDVDYGEYAFYGDRMIVTSGLAGYGVLPRMFNPPEICVVELVAT